MNKYKLLLSLLIITQCYAESSDPFEPKGGYPNLDSEIDCEKLLEGHKYWQEAKETLTQEEKNKLLREVWPIQGRMICAVCIGASADTIIEKHWEAGSPEEEEAWIRFPQYGTLPFIKFLVEHRYNPTEAYEKWGSKNNVEYFKLLLQKGLRIKNVCLSIKEFKIASEILPKNEIIDALQYQLKKKWKIEPTCQKIITYCPKFEALKMLKKEVEKAQETRAKYNLGSQIKWTIIIDCDKRIKILKTYIDQLEQDDYEPSATRSM